MRRRYLIGVIFGLLGVYLSATPSFSAEKTLPLSKTKQPLSCWTNANCVSLIDQCNVDAYCYPPHTKAGKCYTIPAPDKTPCEADGNLCTNDQCFSGVCSTASTKQCTPSQPCEEGTCNAATGDCSYTPKDPGSSCADGNVCNGDEVCDAKGDCLPGPRPNLDDGNPCTIDSCHPVSGIHHFPAGRFTSCADSNICNGEEMCGIFDGICHPGTPIDPDDGDLSTLDSCEDNQIVHRPIPETDGTVAANFGHDTEFLYTGADPYQKAVTPETIDETRAAVLRGRIATLDGSPLPGVKVQILDHDEFGFAYTLGDGTYALAVNGGGELTVVYSIEGYLEAQRTVKTGWHDYYWASDLVMIQPDPNVTEIEFDTATEYQVVMGSEISDVNGPRREVLLIAPGTKAEMVLPDGTLQPMTSLNVRITEYTKGDQGPAVMPAELPPASQYTYAVEYYADEAIAAGSKHVFVDPPMIAYNGNFLDFPVGTQIPMGSYSRTEGKWIPNDNGQVVGILSITGGLADIDLDGDSMAENAATLSNFGITEGERQKVAELFPNVPTSAWRALVPHFTDPWDKNMGGGPGPDDEPPKVPDPTGDDDDPNQCIEQGSIVSCPSQVLREEVPVAGTPFSLHYASNRVPGRIAGYTLEIPLSGETLPERIDAIVLRIRVAGRYFGEVWLGDYQSLTNKHYTFTWDGLGAFYRKMQGKQPIWVDIGYQYPAIYQSASRFGYNGNGMYITTNGTRTDVTLWKRWVGSIGVWDEKARGLGGWSLTPHHIYAGGPKMVLHGDGTIQSASVYAILETAAGNGSYCYGGPCGDGGRATEATLGSPYGIDVGPDGSLFIADGNNEKIRRVGPDGIIQTEAGAGGTSGTYGNGIPATSARLFQPHDVAVRSDGTFYIAERGRHCVRYVDLDGIIHTVAGLCGTSGSSGDDGPAVDARLFYPEQIDLGPDGSLYILDSGNNMIRRIAPDGIIHRVAGTGKCEGAENNKPAIQATLGKVYGMAVGPDGSVYVSENQCTSTNAKRGVQRIRPDGLMVRFAGYRQNDVLLFNGDGGPALGAGVPSPRGLAVGRDGSVYIADEDVKRVRKVDPQGIITTVAGNGDTSPAGDGYQATAAGLETPRYLAVAPSGWLYASSFYPPRVRVVEEAFPALSNQQTMLASDDGSELFVFDKQGRHLQTLNALTGVVKYGFGYDPEGRLLTVTDGDNNVTTIERDANGNPTAIIAPFQQRTEIALGADGYISSITNPELEATEMKYFGGDKQGLLKTFEMPRKYGSSFLWDSLGRLEKDSDAAGGYLALNRVSDDYSYTANLHTTLNRTKSFKSEALLAGSRKRTNTFPNNLQSSLVEHTNGKKSLVLPDDTHIVTKTVPDPRFGLLAPIEAERTIELPSGLTSAMSHLRHAILADPDNVLSLVSQTDTITVNDKTFTQNYDASTRALTTKTPLGRTDQITMDEKGRIVEVSIPGIAPFSVQYDSNGRIGSTTQGARSLILGYDPMTGYLETVTDAFSHVTQYDRDAVGRVTRETRPDTFFIDLTYDPNGNLSSITPPGKPTHSFLYTPVDLVDDYLPPNVAGSGTTKTDYQYNLDKQLDLVVRPDGQTIDPAYDTAGRLSTITIPGGLIQCGYDALKGQLVTATGPYNEGLSYVWDGLLLTDVVWSGDVSGSIHWDYNTDFQVATETVQGDSVIHQYDGDGLLEYAGQLQLFHDKANGRLLGTSLGLVTDAVGYNTYGEVDGYTAMHDTTTLYSVSYTHDALGRISTKTETIGGETHTYGYEYDLAGRLWIVTHDTIAVARYTYDGNGNRQNEGATYDDQDRLLTHGTKSYDYTANGELASKHDSATSTTTTYQYDALGNLLQVNLPDTRVIQYVIDAAGRRVGKKIDGVLEQQLMYRGGLRPVAEIDGAGTLVGRFVYGTRINVPDYVVRSGVVYRIITDHLGSVRLVVRIDTGEVVQRMDYDEWGAVTNDYVAGGFQRVPFGFAGGICDPDTKLVRFGTRDYDPEAGRWTAKDWIGFAGGDPNLFGYVLGDPVNGVDPEGRWIHIVIGAVAGAAIGGGSAWAMGGDPLAGAVSGAVSGGIGALGGPLAGAIGAGTSVLVYDLIAGRKPDHGRVIIVGAVGGLMGGALKIAGVDEAACGMATATGAAMSNSMTEAASAYTE